MNKEGISRVWLTAAVTLLLGVTLYAVELDWNTKESVNPQTSELAAVRALGIPARGTAGAVGASWQITSGTRLGRVACCGLRDGLWRWVGDHCGGGPSDSPEATMCSSSLLWRSPSDRRLEKPPLGAAQPTSYRSRDF